MLVSEVSPDEMETQLIEELEAVLNIPDNTTTQVDGHRRQGDKDLFFFRIILEHLHENSMLKIKR